MSKINIKCPYCNSENVDNVDIIDEEITDTEGVMHNSYQCNHCDEYFYVYTTLEVTKVEVSKDKYKGYKTIYSK